MVGIVTARGGSKGIPGKNVRAFAGKPLIAWALEAALKSVSVSRVIVSTDSEEIAQVSRDFGAEVPFLRPADLATDEAGSFEVVEHTLRWLEASGGGLPAEFMLLQPTSPLRTTEDIDTAAKLFSESGADAVVSVTASNPHPYLSKRTDANGRLIPLFDLLPTAIRRQDLPDAVSVNGAIYILRTAAFLRGRSFVPPDSVPFQMPGERSIDIDEPWQFEVAEALFLNDPASF